MRSLFLVMTSIAVLLHSHGGNAVDDVPVRPVADTETTESGQPMTVELVKKTDKDPGKVTISHEPIENLGMPKMTMVFRVKDPAMLDRLKAGDRIRFVADKVNGAFTVMEFEPVK